MTPSTLARKILALHRKGEALNIHAVKRSHPELLKAAYTFSPFLGWKQAIELAGLDYQSIRIQIESHVPCLICGRHFGNLCKHLTCIHSISSAEYCEEFPGADIVSEELRAKVSFTGETTEPHWEPLLSWEYVLDRTWFWYIRHGKCNADFLMANHEESIRLWVVVRGLSWNGVIRALGLDPKVESKIIRVACRTPEEVIAAMKRRAKEGKTLSAKKARREDTPLVTAAYREFGSWPAAIKAAGLVVPWESEVEGSKRARLRYRTRDAVLKALKSRAGAGLEITSGGTHRGDAALARAVYANFASWGDALKAAGLWEIHTRNPRHGHHYPRYPDAESVLAGIRDRHARGLSLFCSVVLKEDSHLRSAAYRCFGSWPVAVKAALQGIQEKTEEHRVKKEGGRKRR